MTPEAKHFLVKARGLLRQADIVLGVRLPDAAGRTAYLAGFHAAQAFIFERTGKVAKTHKGVHAEFARLAQREPAIDSAIRAFLGRTYNLKAIADYETDPGANVTEAQAREALEASRLFVDRLAHMLGE